jgi:hypothetical protein
MSQMGDIITSSSSTVTPAIEKLVVVISAIESVLIPLDQLEVLSGRQSLTMPINMEIFLPRKRRP